MPKSDHAAHPTKPDRMQATQFPFCKTDFDELAPTKEILQ